MSKAPTSAGGGAGKGDRTGGKGPGGGDDPISLERWLDEQRAALREERDEERAEITSALSELSPQVRGLSWGY
jgi:hypothetical protein